MINNNINVNNNNNNPNNSKLLIEHCFDFILKDLDRFQELNSLSETLPVDLKERMFSYYTNSISNEPSNSPFPITSYPEDRYRDVQLVNRITCQRVIPLCFAMWSSLDYKYEKVRKLIEEEACDVNENDLEGFCPLHYAAIYGRIDACKLLLIHGADCSRKNNFGKTPSDLAQDVKVQQMIKLRAILFRKDEVKEMEQDLQLRRKQIADYQRKQLREDFLKQSKYLGNILIKKGFDSKEITSPLSTSPSSNSSLKFNINNNNNNNNKNDEKDESLNVNNNQTTQMSPQQLLIPLENISIENSNNSGNQQQQQQQQQDSTYRTFIAQIDLPQVVQQHNTGGNGGVSGSHTEREMRRDSISVINIPRSRQSNSTIVPHPIFLPPQQLVNNHFNTISSFSPNTTTPSSLTGTTATTTTTTTTSSLSISSTSTFNNSSDDPNHFESLDSTLISTTTSSNILDNNEKNN